MRVGEAGSCLETARPPVPGKSSKTGKTRHEKSDKPRQRAPERRREDPSDDMRQITPRNLYSETGLTTCQSPTTARAKPGRRDLQAKPGRPNERATSANEPATTAGQPSPAKDQAKGEVPESGQRRDRQVSASARLRECALARAMAKPANFR